MSESSEVWMRIPSAPNYEASSLGRIRRSSPGKRTSAGFILKQRWAGPSNGAKYLTVAPSHGGSQRNRKVHHLVCEAFNGPRPSGKIVAHRNDDRANNKPDNLYWATYAENGADMMRNGRGAAGERAPSAKLTEKQVREIRAAWASGVRCRLLAEQYSVDATNILLIVKRKTWGHVV